MDTIRSLFDEFVPKLKAQRIALERFRERRTPDQRLLGFSLGSGGGGFRCLECLRDGSLGPKRALAIVEFPTLQMYRGAYNFVRALRVEWGPFASRVYAISDDDAENAVCDQADAYGFLLAPSLPTPIRPDKLTCGMCRWKFTRDLSPEDLAALDAAGTRSHRTAGSTDDALRQGRVAVYRVHEIVKRSARRLTGG